ncbi:hypothetical protein ACSBR2_017439 [Camellia fascicularis]
MLRNNDMMFDVMLIWISIQKFSRHLMLNADREFLAQKSAPYCDFYNVRKADTHVHHSACMNQKHLLRFIKSKLRKEPDEVVIFQDGTYLTLNEVFESLDLSGNNNTSVGSSRNSFNSSPVLPRASICWIDRDYYMESLLDLC